MAFVHKPRLWFSEADVAGIRRRVESGEPTAAGIFEQVRGIADKPVEAAVRRDGVASPIGTRYAEACAIVFLLTGDRAYAAKAHDFMLAQTADWPSGDLAKGSLGLFGAIVHECCYAGWTSAQQLAMTRLLYKLAHAARETQLNKGDPHTVTNNHWAVVHAGAAVAAMAIHGHPHNAAGQRLDMTDLILWASARTKAFIALHGDQGLYHEGLGYLGYPASFWLPFMAAAERLGPPMGEKIIESFPNLRNLAAALFSSAAARPTVSDETYKEDGRFGTKLSWNDDGPGWLGSGTVPLAMHYAHEHQKPALKWMFDRLNGALAGGDPANRFCTGFAGNFFTLLYYPYDLPAKDPNGILPRHLTDNRQGITVFRSMYRDGDDAILGAYAKCQFPGGHQQDDAGSVRFMALGYDWIMGGGQDRGGAEYQSVVTPVWNDKAPESRSSGLGAIMHDAVSAHGGVFAMELRKVSVGYHERFVAADFSGDSRSPAVVAILDQLDDHAGRDWLYCQTFSPLLTPQVHRDNGGFDLTAPDGTSLTARFLGVIPQRISIEKMPDSQRTYQSEKVPHIYPGRPYVRAVFSPRENLAIYCVMAVQRGPAPAIELLHGTDVRIGKFHWRRPFGAAIPEVYVPGTSGSLCRFSGGTRTFSAQSAVDALGAV